ncbi:aspartate-semialdehyde dehydrogenase [Candidatus Cytomitobacter indipagum]|uniref:Aspartate-semialdehyde dehydrogenase n=1 Tax=Candidatus Cytomitobacter indipagum TaxID=2601575 RepID=A0A5C0UDI8_9PROT|nr:aspartate-semialdehyde dehydrogenase [Candidatus Cytomitobacter indipagum]QEK37819.1 aspartate-semialdehyde dehydrogenase [Candidatus Cytomitobacter indipagum]
MFNIAIIGASGLIGRSILSVLHERKFPIKNLYLLARKEQEISFDDKVFKCNRLDEFDFKSADIVFNATDRSVIMKYMGDIVESGAFLIDKSDALRMDKDVPLVVSEVNYEINKDKIEANKIVASPNCVAMPAAIILSALLRKTKISHVFMTALQSVSGVGGSGTKGLLEETKKSLMSSHLNPAYFEKVIAFDILPKIGEINSDLSSTEELKIKKEINKIIKNKLYMHVTCARVPVLTGHAIDMHIPCDLSREDAVKALKSMECIHVCDREDNTYVTQRESAGEDEIFVNRIRHIDGVLSMWVSYDNIRSGGAINGVKIAEKIIQSLKSTN